MNKLEIINKHYPELELLTADGFDDAILGVVFDMASAQPRVAYSKTKCVRILVDRDHMSPLEAGEYFETKVEGAYMAEKTPIWVEDELFF